LRRSNQDIPVAQWLCWSNFIINIFFLFFLFFWVQIFLNIFLIGFFIAKRRISAFSQELLATTTMNIMKKYQGIIFYDFLFKKSIFGQNPAGAKEFNRGVLLAEVSAKGGSTVTMFPFQITR
jgi:hypothetical protein